MFEKAFEAFKKQLRCSLHKVHLLCLLSLGLQRSRKCNDTTLQSLSLSLLVSVQDLLYGNPSLYTIDSLLKLLKWFSIERSCIERVVHGSGTDLEDVSINQILVALLRALGLRTRLIMVLNPLPYKTTPTNRKKSVDDTATSSPQKVKGRKKQRALLVKSESLDCIQSNSVTRKRERSSDVSGTKEEGVTRSSDPVTMDMEMEAKPAFTRRTRSSFRDGKTVCSVPKTPEKIKPEDENASNTTGCGNSPYFKKKLRQDKHTRRKKISSSEESESHLSKDSDIDYLSLSTKSGQAKRKMSASFQNTSSDDDDEFVPPKPKKKRESRTKKPARKLKKAVDNSDTTSSSNSCHPSDTLTQSSTARKCKGVTDTISEQTSSDVQLVTVEDTSCWVEVFVASKKKWTCVHLPSCSVGQPQLCEKDCTLPLNYVVAFENGNDNYVTRDYNFVGQVTNTSCQAHTKSSLLIC